MIQHLIPTEGVNKFTGDADIMPGVSSLNNRCVVLLKNRHANLSRKL